MAYNDGLVHIHPFLLLHVTFSIIDVGGSSAAYHAVSIESWREQERGMLSDVLKALSMGNHKVTEWLAR